MPASKTAEYVALYRALEGIETEREPLFRDPFAKAFLSPSLAFALRASTKRPLRAALLRYADWRAPGARTSAIARTCFIDDVARRAAAGGVGQLVLLGAGYDCRAHRLPELRDVRVFEVDRPDTQAAKRERLGRLRRPARGDIVYVAVDFERDDLRGRLGEAGWAADQPTLFVWEGVTNYLTADAVAETLTFVGQAAPGSRVVFTYIHRGVIDGSVRFEGGDKLVRSVQKLHEPWKFGLVPAELEGYLARFGLRLEENLGADEYRARYFEPRRVVDRGYAFYRIAVADVAPPRDREA